jgi:hypothetical protein
MEVFPVKITNSDIIKSGERELIDSIIGDLDWDAIEEIVKNRHKLKIQDDVEYRQGDIVVHNNQVAYKLDFDVKMTLSVVFDRDGNYLSLVTSDDIEEEKITEKPSAPEETSDDTENIESAEESLVAADESTDAAESESSESFSSEDTPAVDPEKAPTENFSKMASHIAEMISEINDD